MYINYIVNVCIMRMQEIANSYKYMYENCAGGLVDARVILQYMHVIYIYIYIYIKHAVCTRSQLISGKVQVMTGN